MLTYLSITVLLIIAELVYFRIAKYYNIVDKPNARSSHTKVVLRGGGIIYLIGTFLYFLFFGAEQYLFLVGLIMVSVVSFVDDIHSLSDSVRLLIQVVAIFLMLYGLSIVDLKNWWIIILGLILCVGVINAYNFMDGINGITGGYSLAVLLSLALINNKIQFVDSNLIYVTILSDLVFCFFNFRPKGKAKCFAGDVGSVGIAFIIIFLLTKLILQTGDFTYIVLLTVYGVDSVLTICHRIMLHENLGTAHRKHAYQLMANELKMSHVSVSLIYTSLQMIIALGMICIPADLAWHWIYLALVCIALAVAYFIFMKKYYHLHVEYLDSLKNGD